MFTKHLTKVIQMEKEKKLDLRVIKTRAALTDALYKLMCEKSLDEITVTELCQRAMIRMATFYKHFGDKTELLVYLIQEMMLLSKENNEIGYDPEDPYSYYSGVFSYLIDFVESNERFVLNVLHSRSGSYVREILEEQIRMDIDEQLRQEEREDLRRSHAMLSAVYASAIVGCVIWWVTQPNRPLKEELIPQFNEFVYRL